MPYTFPPPLRRIILGNKCVMAIAALSATALLILAVVTMFTPASEAAPMVKPPGVFRSGNFVSIDGDDHIVIILDEKPGAVLREELDGDALGGWCRNIYVPIKQPAQ